MIKRAWFNIFEPRCIYLATVGEGRAARHVDGDGARSVTEQRVDASSGEQELQPVECSPVVGTDAPAAPGSVRYRCIDTTAATSAAPSTQRANIVGRPT